MLDMNALAAEYLASKEQVSTLRKRIERMQQSGVIGGMRDVLLTDDEKKVRRAVDDWKVQLLHHEMKVCKYELAASALNTREQMILRLHYENGLSLRQIADINEKHHSKRNNSVSTLNRVRQALVNKFEKQLEAEKPLFLEDLESAVESRWNKVRIISNNNGSKGKKTRNKLTQNPS